ncbi:MerR family transcriptional regulator [Luteipulveratus mongoliensis]|uniref:MerR family transcriptional regulator n=1 Tax=Luteipulveratus mongoliensis TaxID=571913 RepID=A0A0K1JQZ8_9MICO|nr:MerR family transcriptional regulator [Luteipulveratus mongoliensis]
MTIGAVLAHLQDDFPDLTVSKVRYLDAEGLVSPQRRDSGYREYSERDIERLRFVLAAQRDKFWPLKVIRDALDAFDRGLQPDAGPSGRPHVPAATENAEVPDAESLAQAPRVLRLTPRELAEGSGLTDAEVAELVTFHLVRPDGDGHFTESDLTVARAAHALSAYGVQGRHLRAFRLAADREIGLVEQVGGTTPEQRAQVLAQCLSLHVALVRAGLHEQ